MDIPKVGIVGIGSMGMNHCRVLHAMKNVNFVGIYDVDKDKCQEVSSKFKVIYFNSYEELIKAVDAVIIAAPTLFHYILAQQAILQNKHVLVEKPLVTSLEDTLKLTQIAGEKRVIVQVGHIERFNPAYQQLTNIIQPNDIMVIDARRFNPVQRIMDTDVILDLMIHDIDIILNLVKSPPLTIYAVGTSLVDGEQLDAVSALLRFPNGVIANIQANRISQEKIRSLSITERDRFIDVDFLTRQLDVYLRTNANARQQKYGQYSLVEKILVPYADPLSLEIHHFIQSIQLQTLPKTGIVEAKNALEVALQIKNTIYANVQQQSHKLNT